MGPSEIRQRTTTSPSEHPPQAGMGLMTGPVDHDTKKDTVMDRTSETGCQFKPPNRRLSSMLAVLLLRLSRAGTITACVGVIAVATFAAVPAANAAVPTNRPALQDRAEAGPPGTDTEGIELSHALFVGNDGHLAVGHIDEAGHLQQTQASADATHDWTHVVAVGGHVLFVRNDGLLAVGHIDGAGQLVVTQASADATHDWTHVVAVGGHVLFVRNDGHLAVGHIDDNGQLVQIKISMETDPNWTHVVAVGGHVLFVRNDGLLAVAHIDGAGHLVPTQRSTDATHDWTHVVAVA
jgi:hypothetical protein